ncbi:flagella synthesis protein FlgN [Thalassotalea fusca]
MADGFNPHDKLQQQCKQLEQLESLLNTERAILESRDPDKLISVAEEKNSLLVAIQTIDTELGQSLQFKEEKSQGLHDEILQKTEDLLLKCKDINQVNGQIIEHSQLAVERMKSSLLQSHNKSSVTYDAKGKASGGQSSVGIKA